MSLRLNEQPLIAKVYESIPANQIQSLASDIHPNYLQKLLTFIAVQTESSPHLEYHLLWIKHLFNRHGQNLKENASAMMTTFRALQKNLMKQQDDIAKLCDDNKYLLAYLNAIPTQRQFTSKPEPAQSGHHEPSLMDVEDGPEHVADPVQLPGWY